MHKHFFSPWGTREITMAKLIFSSLLVLLQPEGSLRQRISQREERWCWRREGKGSSGILMWLCLVSHCLPKKSNYYHSFTLCSVCVCLPVSVCLTALQYTRIWYVKCTKGTLPRKLQDICKHQYSGCLFPSVTRSKTLKYCLHTMKHLLNVHCV